MNELPKNLLDCFLFNEELDLLEIRLNELDPYVNLFILVEANKTHRGDPKPYHYEENYKRFTDFANKILHIKIEDLPSPEYEGDFTPEIYQRKAIQDIIYYLSDQKIVTSADLVLIGDVDEIPRGVDLAHDLDFGITTPSVLMMDSRLYYLNRSRDLRWAGTTISLVSDVRELGSQGLRDSRFTLPKIQNGWHFSWLGGEEGIERKLNSITDAKETLENGGLTFEDMKINFNKGIDPFGRGDKLPYTVHALDLPVHVSENLHLYLEFIHAE